MYTMHIMIVQNQVLCPCIPIKIDRQIGQYTLFNVLGVWRLSIRPPSLCIPLSSHLPIYPPIASSLQLSLVFCLYPTSLKTKGARTPMIQVFDHIYIYNILEKQLRAILPCSHPPVPVAIPCFYTNGCLTVIYVKVYLLSTYINTCGVMRMKCEICGGILPLPSSRTVDILVHHCNPINKVMMYIL